MKYQVHLDVYEGPLDLLLKRLTAEEIAVGDVSVCTIVDQFLDYFTGIAFSDLDEGGRFLVLAAALLAVKGRLLLPRHEEEDEGECAPPQDDEEGALETDWAEYLTFQDAAATLEARAREWTMVYRRPPAQVEAPEQRGAGENITRLIEAFQGIMERLSSLPQPYVVKGVPYDLDDMMDHVLVRIKSFPEGVGFSDFFSGACGRDEVIFTFLAVLELVYEGKIRVLDQDDSLDLLLIEQSG